MSLEKQDPQSQGPSADVMILSNHSSAGAPSPSSSGLFDDQKRLETPQRAAAATAAPEEPMYTVFTRRQKHFIVFMSGLGGFFSPLSANTYLPSLPVLARELHVSISLINLTITAFMIFQGLAPSVYGDLADMAGRRPAYLISFLVYVAANIGLALQTSYPALFLLRCLQVSCDLSGGIFPSSTDIPSPRALGVEASIL
jgi:hypothetical protein